jgi:hypothetical protein
MRSSIYCATQPVCRTSLILFFELCKNRVIFCLFGGGGTSKFSEPSLSGEEFWLLLIQNAISVLLIYIEMNVQVGLGTEFRSKKFRGIYSERFPLFRGRKCSFRGIPSSAEGPIPKLGTERNGAEFREKMKFYGTNQILNKITLDQGDGNQFLTGAFFLIFFMYVLYSTLLHHPLCQMMLGSNPRQLRLKHWLCQTLTSHRLHLVPYLMASIRTLHLNTVRD